MRFPEKTPPEGILSSPQEAMDLANPQTAKVRLGTATALVRLRRPERQHAAIRKSCDVKTWSKVWK